MLGLICSLALPTRLGVVAAIFPVFLVALVPVLAFFLFLVRYFRPAQVMNSHTAFGGPWTVSSPLADGAV